MFLITLRRIVGPPVAFCWECPLFSSVCRDHGRIQTQNLPGLLEGSELIADPLQFNGYIQGLISLWAIFNRFCYACQATWIWHAKEIAFREWEKIPRSGAWVEVSIVSHYRMPCLKGTERSSQAVGSREARAPPLNQETLKFHMPFSSFTCEMGITISS